MHHFSIFLFIFAQIWEMSKGGRPYSFDYLLASQDHYDTAADVVFVEYDLDAGHIKEYAAAGKTVICVINAGTWEFWREDSNRFPEEVLGNYLDDWPGERWLDVTKTSILVPLMRERVEMAASSGCAGVAADNLIGFDRNTSFSITYQDQLFYNRLLSSEIHVWGMLAGLNNDILQIDDLLSSFDFAVGLRCAELNECNLMKSFVDAGKPVFDVEYTDTFDEVSFRNQVCPLVASTDFSFVLKNVEEDADIYVSC